MTILSGWASEQTREKTRKNEKMKGSMSHGVV